MHCAIKQQSRSLTPLLSLRRGVRGQQVWTPRRAFHHEGPLYTPHMPFPGFLSFDISRIQNTTLKEISENFSKVKISEPTKNVSIVEPLAPIKITPDNAVKKILDPLAKEEMHADSILKKRRRKMNKHKLKRVRKQQRFLMRKLGRQ